jgi:hypothetical protein
MSAITAARRRVMRDWKRFAIGSLVVAVAGCAPAPGPRSAATAPAPGGAVVVYEADARPECPYTTVGEVSERAGALDAGERVRLTERLRRQAHGLGGHALIEVHERMEGDEWVVSGTVIRFTRADCLR